MTLLFVRTFFLIIIAVVGYYIGGILLKPLIGLLIGAAAGVILVVLEAQMQRVSVRGLSSMVFGLLLGVFMANLISNIIVLLPLGEFIQSLSRVILTLIFSYLGAVMALRGKDEFSIIIPYVRFKRQDIKEDVTLLDTSAIIDGRIADIYKTNFFSGRLVVPRLVLQELQRISDSQDTVKKERGRRGMDILKMIQNDQNVDIRIQEDDSDGEQNVDQKLIRLAKIMDARICTTDSNLSRIAQLQDVEVLNIHELVQAVRAVVLTGEEIEVRLIKEGKEHQQAVGYLEDGTMVVVGEGKNHIGQKVTGIVTSVLQTQTGKMIFARLK